MKRLSKIKFNAKLWVYPGDKAAWRFVTVPKDISYKIRSKIKVKRGFGSIRVEAKVGKTVWGTSIFPDSRSGTYLLPIKVSVRRAEAIEDSEIVSVTVRIKHGRSTR